MSDYFDQDATRNLLVDFIQETEKLMLEALCKYDKESSCKIYPSLDLGFPHDLIRLVGGFPTGTFVTWHSNVPFVPVDTTVNVCTSSLFKLSDDISSAINSSYFDEIMRKLGDTSYYLNFQRGNHFISYARGAQDGDFWFVLHSSASEFKKTYNGLFPVDGNWYMDEVKVLEHNNRRLRYLTGKKAELFHKIAHQIEPFNATRHDFFAEVLTNGLCEIVEARHHHHYYMPNDESIMIGSFLAQAGDVVPVFSYPGDPIFQYRVLPSGKNRIEIDNKEAFLVPHGWGKHSKITPSIHIDLSQELILVNGVQFPIESGASLRAHPDLELRRFSVDKDSDDYYFKLIDNYCSGVEIDRLEQLASFNKLGFIEWKNQG